jgi:hypothetical protein
VKRQLEEAHRQHEQTVKALRTGEKDESEAPEVRAARLQQEMLKLTEEHAFEMAEA